MSSSVKTKYKHVPVEVVQRAKRGDEEAFATLYQHYNRAVEVTLIRLVKDGEAVRDIAQDVWAKVVTKFHTFEGNSQFFTWLTRITINEGLMYLRRCKSRESKETPFLLISDVVDNPDSSKGEELGMGAPDRNQEIAPEVSRMYWALGNINPEWGKAIVLHHIMGYGAAEIAKMQGSTTPTIKGYIHRGLKDLRQQMSSPEKP
jgi:RNA polymerase sigma-70 factor (ECF subfamily)